MKEFWLKSAMRLIGSLFAVMLFSTDGSSFCVARDTESTTLADGSVVENCCEGRPAHWPASALPLPVYIYDQTPADMESAITGAIQAWNEVESSFFEMQVVGYTNSKAHISGASVMGFDPSLCGGSSSDCFSGSSSNPAASVDGSPDGFQIQSSTIFADSNVWTTGAHPDPQWVMTHEIGHAMGSLHPGNAGLPAARRTGAARGCGPDFTEATMECCSRQTGDDGTLELDDRAAATYLYPKWKYTVEVEDSAGNPVEGAAVWMHGTCFPHDGDDTAEGGMVMGDIPFCLVGDMELSNTYYPGFTYVTGSDGKTGAFRVMHDNFCFTVEASGFADSYGCQVLPAPGNYLTAVVLNQPPVALCSDRTASADQNCEAFVSVEDGSYDPDGDPITFEEDPPPPYQLGDTPVVLTVTDTAGASDSCQATVTVIDDTPPVIECNAHDIDPPSAPISFTAAADDNCGATTEIVSYDCWRINGAGKRKDKKESCVVSFAGDTVTIMDSGGVGATIEWQVLASDGSGNQTSGKCEVEVLKPHR